MAETHFSESNPSSSSCSLKALFHALDPISLILSQNSKSGDPLPLKLTTMDSFIMERGPRYEAYAYLRESRLRMKHAMQFDEQEEEEVIIPTTTITPPRKQVKFLTSTSSSSSSMAYGTYYSPAFRKGSSSVLAQSVPDFSAALRKENRKPPPFNALPSLPEMTPPPPAAKSGGVLSNSRGSKSASAGEKKKKKNVGVLMARKSYANLDELRNLSSFAAGNAINAGDGKGGRSNGYGGGRKTVLGYTQYF